jgi:hypothetical protein
MPSLDDERWRTLHHAYGEASDIPGLLRRLAGFPECSDYQAEPYFSLWSSLCHQGDVYSASYAAVPEIVRMIEATPHRAHWSALLLVTSIEIARSKGKGPELPSELADGYRSALKHIPGIVAAIAVQDWDDLWARVAASAVAAAKGQGSLAEAILALEPSIVPKFMEWVLDQ